MAFKPKTLYLIRHAESQYNAYMHSPLNWLTFRCCFDPKIYDPVLSPRGELQAKRLNQKLIKDNILSKLDLVVTSPLTRSIQTTLFGFQSHLSSSSSSSSSSTSTSTTSSSSSSLQEPLLVSPTTISTPESVVMEELKQNTTLSSGTTSSYSTFSSDTKEVVKEKKNQC